MARLAIAWLGYEGLSASGGLIYNAELSAALRRRGVRVDQVPLKSFGFGYARGLASNILSLPSLESYDLVLQDEMVHASMCLRNSWIRSKGLPIVTVVHNLTADQPGREHHQIGKAVEGAYLRSVDAVVAVCENTRTSVAALGCDKPAIVAYAGRDHVTPTVDEASVAARAATRGPLRVVFSGVVAPHKGLHYLLEAIAGIDPSLVMLDVAGRLNADSGYVASIRRQIATLGLNERVTLHGELDRDALTTLYAQGHVFALPSAREAYSLAALEALGYGLAALLPVAGGSGELITDPAQGALLEPWDVESWREAITLFATDRSRLAVSACAALRRYRQHGTWADTAAQVLDFLKPLTAARR